MAHSRNLGIIICLGKSMSYKFPFDEDNEEGDISIDGEYKDDEYVY